MIDRKYSVFIFNVASCNDRYCPAYGREFTIEEMFNRVKSIPLITAVDLVMTKNFKEKKENIIENMKRTGLKVASVAMDTFSNQIYKNGSFSSINKKVRSKAIEEGKSVIDFCEQLGCDIFTIWPGQDGFDYIFQADYIYERQLFTDAIAELCDYRKDIKIALEYKIKEPRTHSYISTIGTTLLMIKDIGAENLGVIVDYGHASLGYESPAEAVAICKMYGDKLMHVHINDNYRLWDDDMITGSVHTLEYVEFFYWLRRTGYEGYITIDQYPYREDGREAVNESTLWLNYFETLIDKADKNEISSIIAKKDAIAASSLLRKLITA